MISGRALIALALIGVGAYVLRKGTEAAVSSIQGLGADPTQAELDAKLAEAQAMAALINSVPVVLPPLPQVGPKLWQPT